MSIFGFYFVSGLLREAGWPRRKGFFNNTAVIDKIILDHAIDEMIDWAAALGAGRPSLALQTISEMFRDRDWSSDGRPDIKVFIEGARMENESWRATGAVAPHDVVQPTRFARAGAHRQAMEGIMKTGPKWRGPIMDVKDFKELRVPLEQWFLEGVLWGIGNPKAFETWYQAHYDDQIERLPLAREAGLAVDELPDLPRFLSDSEEIVRNYERDVGPLPAIPESLLADARALGASVPDEDLTVQDVQARALVGFLTPQLQLLGLELEEVPAGDTFVSKRSRGYIYGLAAAVLGATIEKQDAEMAEDIMQAAFTLVWGLENAQRILELTLAECAARDGETLAGSYRAEADVHDVYSGKPHAAVMGFWLLNNGLSDPDQIMPVIDNPRPFPPVE